MPVQSGGKTLGALWIIYGLFRLAKAIWLVLFYPTATVMFGALLSRVANPFALMDSFHFYYVVMIVWAIVAGLIGIVAGVSLRMGSSSARVLAIAAGLLALPEIPLGLMLGVYTLALFVSSPSTNLPASQSR